MPHSLGLLVNIKLIDVNLHAVRLRFLRCVVLRDSCGAEACVATFLQVALSAMQPHYIQLVGLFDSDYAG